VPPEVVTGRVVVVVGGEVVVVVGGEVVVVGDVDPEEVPESGEVVVVVGGEVVVVEVLGSAGACAGTVEDELAPGCSFATRTPIAMVAPVATRAAERVSRRRRASVRCLASGELGCDVDFTRLVLETALAHGSSGRYCLPEALLCVFCEAIPRRGSISPRR
jgi:hypothetical protein